MSLKQNATFSIRDLYCTGLGRKLKANVYQVLLSDGLDSLLGIDDGRLDLVEVGHDLRLLGRDLNLLDLQQLLDLLRVSLLLLSLLLIFDLCYKNHS